MEKGDKDLLTLLEIVSHELRSPLTSIKGFASTLISKWDRLDDETKKTMLQTINKDADRVTRLVGELLDLSRIETGRLQLNRQKVRPDSVAARVIERLRPQAPAHQLDVEVPESAPAVDADPDKLEQVLTNLVENAVKYTEGGKVTITAGPVANGDRADLIQISVADQGEGIPGGDRASVFEKFFRRNDGAARSAPGSGLGLYICKGLVEAHGGRIWVDEAEGGGAVFAFTLPRSAAD